MISTYMAPMNGLTNNSFRNLCLFYNADFVFSELIWVDDLEEEYVNIKLKCDNVSKTIFQICAKNASVIDQGVKKIKKFHPGLVEINYNMGCPQSTLNKKFIAGGILNSIKEIKRVGKIFFDACSNIDVIPSIKIRLGPNPGKIEIYEYLEILSSIGIKKFYVHGRTLHHPYSKPAILDEFNKIKKKFPDLKIIANGDIANYQDYKKICSFDVDGVMIGRKGLIDPNIFKKIKDCVDSPKQNQYEFVVKKKMLLKFLEICKKDELSIDNVKNNIYWMSKELVGGNSFRKSLNDVDNIENIKKIIEAYQ